VAAAAHEQAPSQQTLVAGEEDPIHCAAGLLQPRPGLGTGHDHDVPRRHAHHEIARNGLVQAVPEPIRKKKSGLEAVERQHHRWRLPVELSPVNDRFEVLQGGAAQDPAGQFQPIKIIMSDQALTERWTERIRYGEVAAELVEYGSIAQPLRIGRGQQRQKSGAGHLHPCETSG
jgi:hypothetical protein